MFSLFKTIYDWFLDFLFPPFCVGCEQFGSLLCPKCYGQLEFYTSPIKLKLETNYLDQVQAVCVYAGVIKKLIKAMKYQSVIGAGEICGQLLYYCSWPPENIECLTAVPIHDKRRAQRGFNQAEIIATTLSRLTGKPYQPLLKRLHNTPQLAKLKHKEERAKQLINHIGPATMLLKTPPHAVLLIDDVVTSGATLNECAKILKQNGVSTVYALCVAHGM